MHAALDPSPSLRPPSSCIDDVSMSRGEATSTTAYRSTAATIAGAPSSTA